MSSTHTALEQLCTALDAELERQEVLRNLVEAQRAAVRAHDHKTLEARTEAIRLLAHEAQQAEAERMALFDQLAAAYELPETKRNLTGLIAAAPAPFARRLRALQTTLRDMVVANQDGMQKNARAVRHSLRAVTVSLSHAQPAPQPAGYAAPRTGHGKPAPVLLDQRG